ncbi:MAG: SMP-30/gluconolactonase/LRE family protein [Bacteroidota bacterium]
MKKFRLIFFAFPCLLLGMNWSCKNAEPPTEPPAAAPADTSSVRIERSLPELDSLIAPDAEIEVLADGFEWTEGPVWLAKDSSLLFSDIPPNKIMKWKEGGGVQLYLTPSGYTSKDSATMKEPGSNGLLLDSQGRLVLCQHGDRRIARMNAPLEKPKPDFTTLAGKWNGKRLNSPNDAVFDSKGNLWFTDPPYGLTKQADDPDREIPFQGVYRLRQNGQVDLMIDSLSRPNGIAFSPDGTKLYVANSDPDRAIWMVYDVQPNGSLANGKVFFDATEDAKVMKGLPDGLKVSQQGVVFASGPGGIWIFKPDATLLGKINTGQATSNCTFGNDGKALYITADMYLMRVKLL